MQDLRSAIQHGLYDPNYEHDACGVGMVLHMKGAKSHAIVENGLRVLENMTHRGAENADNKTGDGAGIMLQIPHEFILLQGIPVPEKGHYGTGLVFLPKGEAEMESCMITLTQYIDKEGLKLLAVRDVPVNSEILGEMARSNEPHIKQIFVLGEEGLSQDELEHKLYLLRKKIEKEI